MAADDTAFELDFDTLLGSLYTPDARDRVIFGEYYVADGGQF